MESISEVGLVKSERYFREDEINNHTEKKKKHKRRRRSGRHKNEVTGTTPNALKICFTPLPSQEEEPSKQEKNKKKKGKGGPCKGGPVLRPVGAQVPRAPNNSTQFIMDDHENSTLFIHFNREEMQYQLRKREEDESGSSPYPPSDWLPYNERDFQTTYQSAREDDMMNGTRESLQTAILGLEAKANIVSSLLAASPSRLLAQLQSQLLRLQEDNAYLKSKVEKQRHHIEICVDSSSSTSTSSSSSSSDSESESDSTQSSSSAGSNRESSSECSIPDCATCALQREEEEKENTCPGNSVVPET